MMEYLKLIRVKHWLKNTLVFLPLFFSLNIFNLDYVLICIISFLIFCFASSIVYVLNDLNDIEKDRKHLIKKNRPLASGTISKKSAWIVIGVLIFIVLLTMLILYIKVNNVFVFIIPSFYIILNILYSKIFKNIPILDVVFLVLGFILRIIYGGLVINVVVSKYLYLMIMFGAFYLGFGKRRNEFIKNGKQGRKVLEFYNKDFLDKNMYVCLALAIVSYTLWCVDPIVISKIGNDYLFWTIPILMVILQLYSLNIEGNSYGDPIEVVLGDKKLVCAIIFYIIVMGILLYV